MRRRDDRPDLRSHRNSIPNAAANAVIVYDRSASGGLTWSGTFPTGGSGGSPGSQGAVVISEDGRWLFAVDAGSNDIAVFKIANDGLVWSDRIASGGIQSRGGRPA